jgi:glycosyltransferase involved in cell wall biosynthesis
VAAIVWVTAEPPDRHGGGGNIRQSYLLEHLARAIPTTLLVTDERPDDVVTPLLESTIVVPRAPRRASGDMARRARTVASAVLPLASAERRDSRSAVAALAPTLKAIDAQLVIVEHTGLADLARLRRPGQLWALTVHNVASLSARQAIATAPRDRDRWAWRREMEAAERFERWAMRQFDTVFTVSREDAAALPRETVIVPNGVDAPRFAAVSPPTGNRIVFTGTLDFFPNIDGLEWFCREVWPRVRDARPAAELDVVGRRPHPRVTALEGRGVAVHADVPDVLPHLARARLAVVPLRLGSGTRLKALEALAAGRPVVGTNVGLAGLGLTDGEGVLIRDDPAEFARAVVELLGSDEATRQLGGRGAKLAARFDWAVVGARFVEELARMLP